MSKSMVRFQESVGDEVGWGGMGEVWRATMCVAGWLSGVGERREGDGKSGVLLGDAVFQKKSYDHARSI